MLDTDFHRTSLEHLKHTPVLTAFLFVLCESFHRPRDFCKQTFPAVTGPLKRGNPPQHYLAHHVFAARCCIIGSFPDGEPTCQCRRRKRHGSDPWVGKIWWIRARQPTPVLLPGESHGLRSLEGYSPQGCKESDTTEMT